MEMYTVGKLSQKFKLSRSALLYYDSIGLLSPTKRGNGKYRLYSESDMIRLGQICVYREAGLSLEKIKEILDKECNSAAKLLQHRFEELSCEIKKLRQQQQYIITLLQNESLKASTGESELDELTIMFDKLGISSEIRWRFHHEFELAYPERHQLLLEALGLSPEEIEDTRSWSRQLPEMQGEVNAASY